MDTHRHTGKEVTEVGTMLPQTIRSNCAHWMLEEVKENSLPETLEKVWPCQHFDSELPASRAIRKCISAVPSCNSLGHPYETNTHTPKIYPFKEYNSKGFGIFKNLCVHSKILSLP